MYCANFLHVQKWGPPSLFGRIVSPCPCCKGHRFPSFSSSTVARPKDDASKDAFMSAAGLYRVKVVVFDSSSFIHVKCFLLGWSSAPCIVLAKEWVCEFCKVPCELPNWNAMPSNLLNSGIPVGAEFFPGSAASMMCPRNLSDERYSCCFDSYCFQSSVMSLPKTRTSSIWHTTPGGFSPSIFGNVLGLQRGVCHREWWKWIRVATFLPKEKGPLGADNKFWVFCVKL